MTDTGISCLDTSSEGRRGLFYTAQDRSVWEPRIRAVQDRTFARDGVTVEDHDREAAFHRAAARVDAWLTPLDRQEKKSPGRISERHLTRIAAHWARTTSGYRPGWTYIPNAVFVTASLALTVAVTWHLGWVMQLFVTDLPPREQQIDGDAVLLRVLTYGGAVVSSFSLLMALVVVTAVVIAVIAFFRSRDRVAANRRVLLAGICASMSMLLTLSSLLVLAVAVESIDWIQP